MSAICTARQGMTLSGHPTPFVLDEDGFQQCGGATVVDVLRHTDLGKMHADLPMDGQTIWLVCNVALDGLKRLLREPQSLASPPFKIRRFFADSCKRLVGACKLSSAP